MILLIFASRNIAATDDVIYTKNGDRITGEIKKLQRGVIHIDPSYGENVFQIDWDDVERVESTRSFVVETSGGKRISGTVKQDPATPTGITIEDESGPVEVQRPNVVAVLPYDAGFWNRLNASIDLGTTVTKSNSSKQATVNARAGYAAELWGLNGALNLARSTVGEERSRRAEANVDFLRFIGQKWFGVIGADFLNSDELQLSLRTTVAPGVGRFLKRTNRLHWQVAGGGQWNNERFTDSELGNQSSAEAWAGTELNLFDMGDVSWITQAKVSPSLTQSGRVRLDFNTDLKVDLPKDLYFRIGIRNNFDSQPSNDTPRNDYIFSLGLGWEL